MHVGAHKTGSIERSSRRTRSSKCWAGGIGTEGASRRAVASLPPVNAPPKACRSSWCWNVCAGLSTYVPVNSQAPARNESCAGNEGRRRVIYSDTMPRIPASVNRCASNVGPNDNRGSDTTPRRAVAGVSWLALLRGRYGSHIYYRYSTYALVAARRAKGARAIKGRAQVRKCASWLASGGAPRQTQTPRPSHRNRRPSRSRCAAWRRRSCARARGLLPARPPQATRRGRARTPCKQRGRGFTLAPAGVRPANRAVAVDARRGCGPLSARQIMCP